MQQFAKQVGLFYLFNASLWIVVSALAWLGGRAARGPLSGRKIEPESVPIAERRAAVLQTFARSMVALSLMQGVIFVAFPQPNLEPAGPGRLLLEALVAALIFDVLFYAAHRALHTRALWRFHDLHHSFRVVGPWARNTDNAGQVFIIGLFTLPLNLLPIHLEAKGLLLLASTSWNLFQHLGYQVFPRWTWLRRVFVTPTYHSMHHTEVDCNYGYFFVFWDDLFKTTHQAYAKRFLGDAADAASERATSLVASD